jgi:hypothetical protein
MRISDNEDTMQVNLNLANGQRVDAIVRVDDADKIHQPPPEND